MKFRWLIDCHISPLVCKTFHIVLLSFDLSSSFVQFNNGPDYLTRGTAQVFIPSMRFQLKNLVSRSFPFLLKYIFSFMLVGWCSLSLFSSTCNVSFLQVFLFFFFRYLPFYTFPFEHVIFFIAKFDFYSWLYFLIVCIIISNIFPVL